MILRPMTDNDRVEIAAWPSYPNDFADLDYALREQGWIPLFYGKPGVCFHVAINTDRLIGLTLIARNGVDDAEFRIALRADQLGLGYGEIIARLALGQVFADSSLARVHLFVRKNNPRAKRVYEKLGFVLQGECLQEILGVAVAFDKMEVCRKCLVI